MTARPQRTSPAEKPSVPTAGNGPLRAAENPNPIPQFYLPTEVAEILRCSEWWVKEQARRGRIPFCWIGGGYRFLPEHLAEIAQLFERRTEGPPPTPPGRSSRQGGGRNASRRRTQRTPVSSAELTAKMPPRVRRALALNAEVA